MHNQCSQKPSPGSTSPSGQTLAAAIRLIMLWLGLFTWALTFFGGVVTFVGVRSGYEAWCGLMLHSVKTFAVILKLKIPPHVG